MTRAASRVDMGTLASAACRSARARMLVIGEEMRHSRLLVLCVAVAIAIAALPHSALGFTVIGASGETTRDAYGRWYAGEQKCAGTLCHAAITSQETVHGNMVTDLRANPAALRPGADSGKWPTPYGGISLLPSSLYLKLGDNLGFLEYTGFEGSYTVNPVGDLPIFSGAEWNFELNAWQGTSNVTAGAYDQSCSQCHNMGVTRPSNATFTLASGAQQTTKTPTAVVGLSIQCEVCHGTGKNPGGHKAGIPDVVGGYDILKAQVCGQCHVTGTTPQKNVTGGSFGNPNGYTTDMDLSAFLTPNTTVPTEQQFMNYINNGGAKPAFLPNGDDYSQRHTYYNEWLNNKVPAEYGGMNGHADPVNAAVVGYNDALGGKCVGCHSGLGFLNRIEARTPMGSLIVTDQPTTAQVQADDPGIACAICHTGHVGYKEGGEGYDSMRRWGDGTEVSCGDCHNWQFEVLEQPVQSELVGIERHVRPAANQRSRHPQREMFSGGEGGTSGTGGLWGVAPMGEFMPGTECKSCHMPRTHREGMPANDDGSYEGTRQSHRFHVTMPGDAARWKLRKGGDSCTDASCHVDTVAADYTRTDFQEWIDSVQAGTARNSTEVTSALAAVSSDLGLAGSWLDFIAAQPSSGGAASMSAAEWKMLQKSAQNADFVINDASLGVHQPRYSAEGLRLASLWARSYGAAITASKSARIDGVDGVRITGTLTGNDGRALIGGVVKLEESADGGATWSVVQSRTMTASSFAFNTSALVGDTSFRCSYSPDAGVVYYSGTMVVSVPVTSIVLTPSEASTQWVDSNVSVSMGCSEPGAFTIYSLSGATVQAPAVYSGPFVITADGITTITFWSVGAEATEMHRTQQICIDQATPSITSDAVSLYTNSAAIHITGIDPYSGPKYVEYSLDWGPWVNSGLPTATVNVSALGPHYLRARSTNNLDHTSAEVAWFFVVKSPVSVAKSPTVSTSYLRAGRYWRYSVTLRSPAGVPLAGKLVYLQRSYNGRTWRNVASYRTNASGYASRNAKFSSTGTTYWRWYVPADASYYQAYGSRTRLVVR